MSEADSVVSHQSLLMIEVYKSRNSIGIWDRDIWRGYIYDARARVCCSSPQFISSCSSACLSPLSLKTGACTFCDMDNESKIPYASSDSRPDCAYQLFGSLAGRPGFDSVTKQTVHFETSIGFDILRCRVMWQCPRVQRGAQISDSL